MTELSWINPYGGDLWRLESVGPITRPALPYILDSRGIIRAIFTHAANRHGVVDRNFLTLEEAKEYVEAAVVLGLERGM